VPQIAYPNLWEDAVREIAHLGSLPLGILSLGKFATWEVCHLGSLPLGKFATWEVAIGKMPLEKYLKPNLTLSAKTFMSFD